VTLTAAAAATKRLKVDTGVCLVIQRDTIQTAKLVASIDQVSGARSLFGIDGGWNAEEMADHGTAYPTRFKKMGEQVEAMKQIWTNETPEYHGAFVDFPPMITWPKPVQKPHPPVIVGGAFAWPRARRSAMATAILSTTLRVFARWPKRPAAIRALNLPRWRALRRTRICRSAIVISASPG
jgi:alkanesulfonate monooxygenase SsuD/methylene tetrahydromethanopterin reductase-like flavin-dependent oxidoreductase (luciferase family)